MAPLQRDREKLARMEQAVRMLLQGLGEDIDREGLRDTPKRVAKALLDCTQGYHQDTSSTLGTALFHEPIVHQGGEGIVVVRDIDFASTNEETLLPFHGRCHVAYRPKDGVVLGLSKLARLTKQYAKRLQTQERLAASIALALQHSLECHGVAVVLQARHLSNHTPPDERTNACVTCVFASKASVELKELLALLDLEDMPPSAVTYLDHCGHSYSAPSHHHHMTSSSASAGSAPAVGQAADPGVPAPGTPDPRKKDTEGDHDDLPLDLAPRGCEEMEVAMQRLLVEVGENPTRPGLAGAARRYVMSLLASTSGYHMQHPSVAHRYLNPPGGWPQLLQAQPQIPQGQQQQQQGRVGSGAVSSATSCGLVHGTGLGSDRVRTSGIVDTAVGSSHAGYCVHAACCWPQYNGQAMAAAAMMAPLAAGPLRGTITLRLPFASQCEHHMLPFYGNLMVAYCPGSQAAAVANGEGDGETVAVLPRTAVEQAVLMYTKRLQVQERITHQVADAVEGMLRAAVGVAATAAAVGNSGSPGGCTAPLQGTCGLDRQQPQSQPLSEGDGTEVVVECREAAESCGGVMVLCDAAHMCMVARGVENHRGSTTTFAVRGVFARRPDLRRAVLRLFREQRC